jgi:hypothetical protein
VLGFMIPFWGFLLAPPLLAVVYAFKARRVQNRDLRGPSVGIWKCASREYYI